MKTVPQPKWGGPPGPRRTPSSGSALITASILAILSAVLVAQPPAPKRNDPPDLWRHRNLGKALYENPATISQAPAELKKALDLAPDSFRDRLNYGLALLRAGDIDKSIVELEAAQKLNADLPYTWFNLGIAYKRQRRYPDAIKQFERMTQLAPDEPVGHYNLGLLYRLSRHDDAALQQFEIASKLDPRMVAPRFQIYTYYRLHGDEATASRYLTAFEEAKQRQQAADETEDVEWCFYAELYDPQQAHPPSRDLTPPATLKFEERRLTGSLDAKTAGLVVIDVDGDRRPDLLAWSRDGVQIYRSGLEPIADSGLADLKNVTGVAAGDYDNDGLADLCILTTDGPRLYHNVKGRFERSPAKLPSGPYDAAVWLDFDHDYDVDLFLLGANSALLRNEGASGFHDYTAHFPFEAGHAVNALAFRVIPDTKGIDLAVAYADRSGVLYRDRLRGIFAATPFDSIPPHAASLHAIDIDNDGQIDVVFTSPQGISLARNRNGHFETQKLIAPSAFALADFENRGLADVLSSSGMLRNRGLAEFSPMRMPDGMPQAVALAAADFDGDGREDIAAIAADGSVHVFLNRTETRNSWLEVALTGVKNLKAAPGTEVEVKAGDHYQKQLYTGTPLLFGMGAHPTADTVRISWPNGMMQNQTNEAARRSVVIKEAPRLAGSCPMIFTWNGRGYQFITDVLGVAPLGASSGDGGYFPVDHDEYVSIPAEALAARDGIYDVRITEELHEVSYLDQVKLIALDHPANVEVYTNEKFKSPPFPEFRLYGVKKRIRPVAAHDDHGRDVLPSLLARDRIYARGFTHDQAGVARTHSLTLDFGKAAPNGRAILLLNGWVDWADGSTFMGASQGRGPGLITPYLQVKDSSSRWRTVIDDMGMPAGKPKTIAVDVNFLSSSREVRIVTNLCLYWDEIFLSEDAAPPRTRLTTVAMSSADLRLRGFSRTVIDPSREQPESFIYSDLQTNAPWNQTPGLYTRYGDVRELAVDCDDRLIIMGAGDELSLRFDGRALPPLPPNWRRDFLLLVDGWAKDADANTAFSQTVEPLPFHSMSRYPFPPSEHFPDDPAHRAWRSQYNTRPAARFIEPLITAALGEANTTRAGLNAASPGEANTTPARPRPPRLAKPITTPAPPRPAPAWRSQYTTRPAPRLVEPLIAAAPGEANTTRASPRRHAWPGQYNTRPAAPLEAKIQHPPRRALHRAADCQSAAEVTFSSAGASHLEEKRDLCLPGTEFESKVRTHKRRSSAE